jgi:ethanolamine utilization protein EutM
MAAQALGLIEMRGLVGVTEAADAAVKAASVSLSGVEKIEGGLVSIRVLGDVGAVQAVEAGALAGGLVGELIAKHIIPNPHDDLIDAFCLENRSLNGADLESYSVTQLRRLARETEGLAIQGREISHANREQLIQELRKTQETES